MTPKEKAIELYNKFSLSLYNANRYKEAKIIDRPKQCALIAVEEMLNVINEISKNEGTDFGFYSYWQEVKKRNRKTVNILLVNHISSNPSRIGGVQYHRMVKPHAVLRRLHPGVDMVMSAAVTDSEELGMLLDQTDLVLFSRMINDGAAEILNKRGIPFGLDLDDHWYLPKDHILYEHYTKNGISEKTEQSIRDAHFVIVTTPYLAAEVEKINPNVHVIENGIDEDDEIWQPNKVASERLRFGFTQGNTHLADIKSIADSVVKSYTDNKFYKNAQVVLTGFFQSNPNEPTIETLYELFLTGNYKALKYYKDYVHELRILHHSKITNAPYRRVWGVEVTEFARVYNEIDVSVVPLLEGHFNSCKSELKMLEAGFKDCAVMVSHVKPYDLLATDKNSFNLSTHSFYELQRIILNNPNLVADKKAQLREDVQKYSLNRLSKKRKQIYEHYIGKV